MDVEGRALECTRSCSRKEMEAQWKRVHRGWYLGERSFKGRLLERIGGWLEGRKAESVNGEAKAARNEADAERWIGMAMAELGLDEGALKTRPKGAEEKLAMAWWLRRHTTLSRQWIARRLGMGHETRVTLAVRSVEALSTGRLARIKRRIERVQPINDS